MSKRVAPRSNLGKRAGRDSEDEKGGEAEEETYTTEDGEQPPRKRQRLIGSQLQQASPQRQHGKSSDDDDLENMRLFENLVFWIDSDIGEDRDDIEFEIRKEGGTCLTKDDETPESFIFITLARFPLTDEYFEAAPYASHIFTPEWIYESLKSQTLNLSDSKHEFLFGCEWNDVNIEDLFGSNQKVQKILINALSRKVQRNNDDFIKNINNNNSNSSSNNSNNSNNSRIPSDNNKNGKNGKIGTNAKRNGKIGKDGSDLLCNLVETGKMAVQTITSLTPFETSSMNRLLRAIESDDKMKKNALAGLKFTPNDGKNCQSIQASLNKIRNSVRHKKFGFGSDQEYEQTIDDLYHMREALDAAYTSSAHIGAVYSPNPLNASNATNASKAQNSKQEGTTRHGRYGKHHGRRARHIVNRSDSFIIKLCLQYVQTIILLTQNARELIVTAMNRSGPYSMDFKLKVNLSLGKKDKKKKAKLALEKKSISLDPSDNSDISDNSENGSALGKSSSSSSSPSLSRKPTAAEWHFFDQTLKQAAKQVCGDGMYSIDDASDGSVEISCYTETSRDSLYDYVDSLNDTIQDVIFCPTKV